MHDKSKTMNDPWMIDGKYEMIEYNWRDSMKNNKLMSDRWWIIYIYIYKWIRIDDS